MAVHDQILAAEEAGDEAAIDAAMKLKAPKQPIKVMNCECVVNALLMHYSISRNSRRISSPIALSQFLEHVDLWLLSNLMER